MSLLDQLSNGLTVEIASNLAPTLTVQPLAASSTPGGPPPLLLRLLQPRVRVLENGAELGTLTPAGMPSDTPWLGLAAVGTCGALLVLAFLLGRRSAQ